MLSDKELETALSRIEWRMDKLNTLYLQKVGEQVNEIGQLSPSSVNRLIQMRKASASVEKISTDFEKALADEASNDKSDAEFFEALTKQLSGGPDTNAK